MNTLAPVAVATIAAPTSRMVKIVVALLDGRRLKGYSLNLSPLKDYFDLSPADDSSQEKTRIDLANVKAVFFVKDFAGVCIQEAFPSALGAGRNLQVTFVDGEKLTGVTLDYHPRKPYFFLVPTDPSGNNIRILVVSRNTSDVRG